MKKLLSILLIAFIMIAISSCGVKYYYAKAKPFKPDRRSSQVRKCSTYNDVKFSSYDYYRMRKKR